MRTASSLGINALMAVAITTLVSACAGSPHGDAPRGSEDPSSAVSLLTYRCESDALIRATYPTDSVALMHYQGQTHEMQIARAASGVRYVGDGLQWWTKGNGPGASGTLSRVHNANNADGEIIETCRQIDGDS